MTSQRASARRDDCPECGEERIELVVTPGKFYCPICATTGEGPAPLRVGSQLRLEEPSRA